ncbi:MAG: hydratase [Desulfovibrio sp.]|jgi:aconitate hydratase|nr:hydratase [Desulfovibrio sp.]
MISVSGQGCYYYQGDFLDAAAGRSAGLPEAAVARRGGIAARILEAHCARSNEGPGNGPDTDQDTQTLHIAFDALASHDITYVGIVQTARASGLENFPLPYVLTNCHNSLCAVGGTINEDDHLFGLSAAQKYGGEYVPAHLAVIHQYIRETRAACGSMILGSDSHTRYGALGCMGIGEGGPELVRQLLSLTYDLKRPEIVAVYLEGAPRPGVGPQDLSLALIRAVFDKGLVKNKVLEFIGPGIASLSIDFRMGFDVMTTESACLSSVWQTDAAVRDWLEAHGRSADFKELSPEDGVWYDSLIRIDLSRIEPMIALPFHPARAWSIREFLQNARDLLADVEKEAAALAGGRFSAPDLHDKFRQGKFFVDQGIVSGCSGGSYENIARMAAILSGKSTGNGAFSLSAYPASQPIYLELMRKGHATALLEAGVVLKTAFCGPCFGAGDTPAHNAFSIRHTTRNFENREGSVPQNGQMAYVALMDARSIAATALNGGSLTPATDLSNPPPEKPEIYAFDRRVYDQRVYRGVGRADPAKSLRFGPNISDWPALPAFPENILLNIACALYDPVTSTDELIPSGETSSYRSNPLKLAEFALSRKDPGYVGRAKDVLVLEEARLSFVEGKVVEPRFPLSEGNGAGQVGADGTGRAEVVSALFTSLGLDGHCRDTSLGSALFALKPGDGSAREQAASCQKILGGWANIAAEYATRRYRSNLVNWGLLPLIMDRAAEGLIQRGDFIFLHSVRQVLCGGKEEIQSFWMREGERKEIVLRLPDLSREERKIILAGCLMNYMKRKS